MATTSLVDYLSEKLYSLSSKMWSNPFQPSSTSFLMNGNTKQYDLTAMFGEIRDKNEYQQIPFHPTYPFLPLHRFATGIFGGFKSLKGLDKPNSLKNYMAEKGVSPYLFNFISESYQSKYWPSDSSVMLPDSNFPNPVKESVFDELQKVNQNKDNMMKDKAANPQVMEVTVNISHLPTKEKSKLPNLNPSVSPSVRLNIELAHRKTKEMSKRSKRRRRRQKKNEQLNNSSTSASDDDGADVECVVADNICSLSKNPDFECSLSVTHTVQLSPRNSFLIPVISDSDDDSEWETFSKKEISAVNDLSSSEIDTNSSSSNSSPVKCKNSKPSSFIPVDCSVHVSSIISFVVPEDDSDDDSDWDTCETNAFSGDTDLELSGLYFNNLCMPQSYYKNEYNSDVFKEDPIERLQQRTTIIEANNKWNKLESGQKSNTPSKVFHNFVSFGISFSVHINY